MRSILYTLLIGCFVAAVYWAYDVNYQTRAVEADIRKLRIAIRHEKETTKVLETEWSYLNRPERLSALAEEHFDYLGLAPMRADHFASAGMVAYPLPPFAGRGEDPDDGAQQSRRIDAMRREKTRERKRARTRLILMGLAFTTAFGAVGTKMGMMAAPLPEEEARRAGVEIKSRRADIVDRNGTVLATNIATSALYAHPQQLIDKVGTAARLAEIFPDVDAAKLLEQFNSKRKFLWLKRRISPEQQQAVHEIGDPGLLFGPRQTRIYPNGRLASHIVGGAGYGADRTLVRSRTAGR